jgi:hypothetical protein
VLYGLLWVRHGRFGPKHNVIFRGSA